MKLLSFMALIAAVSLLATMQIGCKAKLGGSLSQATTPQRQQPILRAKGTAPQPVLAEPKTEGGFQVLTSSDRNPSVRIANDSDSPFRFALRVVDAKGNLSWQSMEVGAWSENVMQVERGHYEAAVFSMRSAQLVAPGDSAGPPRQLAAGDATFREFHEYRARFVDSSDEVMPNFHVGD